MVYDTISKPPEFMPVYADVFIFKFIRQTVGCFTYYLKISYYGVDGFTIGNKIVVT